MGVFLFLSDKAGETWEKQETSPLFHNPHIKYQLKGFLFVPIVFFHNGGFVLGGHMLIGEYVTHATPEVDGSSKKKKRVFTRFLHRNMEFSLFSTFLHKKTYVNEKKYDEPEQLG